MKILMITRKVDRNDSLAGFTYNWVKKMGQNISELFVICLEKGDVFDLPENIKIFSLGKEVGVSRFRRFCKFQRLALEVAPKVDGIFCHMNPEYTIAMAPAAKIFGKKIIFWYTHGRISWRLRLAEKLADIILTASKKSFRLPSKKLVITGHGIDTERFKPAQARVDGIIKIISIGRISPTKDYETMIKAIDILAKQGKRNIKLTIIGQAGLDIQKSYFESLKAMVIRMNLGEKVQFIGAKPNREIPAFLQQSDLFINLSGTGSLDKAVLEAMSCGCLILTGNEAFAEILPEQFLTVRDAPKELAEKISWLMGLESSRANEFRQRFRQEVVTNHNLDNLVKKIINQFQ